MMDRIMKFETGTLPFIIATIGEFTGLFGWLHYHRQDRFAMAALVLFCGFLAERVAVLFWVNKNFGTTVGVASTAKPAWQRFLGLMAITWSEIAIWVVFFWVYTRFGPLPALVVLYALELGQHAADLGLLKGKPIREFLLDGTAHFITVVEAGGGTAMVYFVLAGQPWIGAAVMLACLAVEHVVQGGMIRPAAGAPRPAAGAA